MPFTTEDRSQAWSYFLHWWDQRQSDAPAQDEYYAKDAAGAAWLAAWEWAATLRGDD